MLTNREMMWLVKTGNENVSTAMWLKKRGNEKCSGNQVVLRTGRKHISVVPCLGQEVVKFPLTFSSSSFSASAYSIELAVVRSSLQV
jgi:hypothetical protein